MNGLNTMPDRLFTFTPRVLAAGVRAVARYLYKGSGLAASIILVTENRSTYLNLSLAALARQLLPYDLWEVIIADNASQDNITTVLDRYEKEKCLPIVRI